LGRGTGEKDWTGDFFLAMPTEAAAGEGPRLGLLRVRGFREDDYREMPLGGGDAARTIAHLADEGEVWLLSHDFTWLEEAGLEETPPSLKLLRGKDLAVLLFPCAPSYSPHLLREETAPSGERGEAGRYLRSLISWRQRIHGMDASLRGQLAALLHACGDPWAFFFSPHPAEVKPLTFSEKVSKIDRAEDGPPLAGGVPPGGVPPDIALEELLSECGPLACIDDGFESRPQQREMARAVFEAMSDDAVLAVEAGTGVGKSLAYLAPSALVALYEPARVLVSTYTKSLQDQLCKRDLPRLEKALPALRYCRLKGRSNYLCLRRWDDWCVFAFNEAYGSRRLLLDREKDLLGSWARLLLFLDSTSQGDLEELSLEAAELLREHLPDICSLPEECLGPACSHRERCFLEAARDTASRSHLVVVNHALLLADASQAAEDQEGQLQHPVLPPFDRLVIDEAHHLEAVTTEAFSRDLSMGAGLALLDKLEGRRGLLRRCEACLSEASHPDSTVPGAGSVFRRVDSIRERTARLQARMDAFFALRLPELPLPRRRRKGQEESESAAQGDRPPRAQGDAGGEMPERRGRVVREVVCSPAWEELEKEGAALSQALEELASDLAELGKSVAAACKDQPAAELEGKWLETRASRLALLCSEYAETLRDFFRDEPEDRPPEQIRWWEARGGRARRGEAPFGARICVAPAETGPLLSSRLLSRLRSAVLTSATLRTGEGGRGFSYFASSCGLDLLAEEGREVRYACLGSPFDYSRQAACLLVTDLCDPGGDPRSNQRYLDEVVEVLGEALLASSGRGLVLFTSYDMLERASQRLFPLLEEHGIPCLKQERGSGNMRLLERFREEVGSVLFATASFWEGVDVPGESLSLVAITRLPFSYIGDPLLEGRIEYLEKALGKNGWHDLYLPRTVMRFRQGLGRLIRRADDRGVMLVLDPRLSRRNYSRPFLASLPHGLEPRPLPSSEVGEAVRRFFGDG
jgi:ATP-dependent DNA helicase DinG